MGLHAILSSEDKLLTPIHSWFMRIQNTWLNEIGFLDLRMTNVLILKQFPRILVNTLQTLQVYSTLKRRGNERFHVVSTWNTRGVFVGYVLALLIYSYIMTTGEVSIWNIFQKVDSSRQIAYVNGNSLLRFQVCCNLIYVNSLNNTTVKIKMICSLILFEVLFFL